MILAAIGVAACLAGAAERRPAVLFVGGVHAGYVARPLTALGVHVDACAPAELAARLASGRYNVVVVGTLDDAGRAQVDAFLARGGGVLMTNPGHAHARPPDWQATNQWLAARGARPRFEILRETDATNLVRDILGTAMSWSDAVAAPFNEGVPGVLTHVTGHEPIGVEPPMSFDFSGEWTVIVRAARSVRAEPSKLPGEDFAPWIPGQPIESSPPLAAIRSVGPGRLAVVGIRGYWLFTPPPNCPTAQAMLTAGAGGKPSAWLRVFAHMFRWLAEPSLQAGWGGAETPPSILDPPVAVWEPEPPFDWTKIGPLADQPQVAGLIGARTALSGGTGTVADYVKAARAAGLQFLVFLEDSLRMDEAQWRELVQACEAASDRDFAAVPGLTYEDAQGNHLYAFADNVKFPKPEWRLPDRRLATTSGEMRNRVYFDYVNEYMKQHILSGFWQHRRNWLHVADYKLYNSFPVYSFIDGQPVDEAFDEYRYLMGWGGCHAVLAFEIMTRPDLVPVRAREGWRVVVHRGPAELRQTWHHGAWSFSGSGSQYITNGPTILAWRRVQPPWARGQWWRPDLFAYRVGLRVASPAGLKSVTIYDGDRAVLRRWLPGGAKTFEHEMVLAGVQQKGLFPVVEDMAGRRAIGMEYWHRNLLLEEFICSDRCNFLGNARLRTRRGEQIWTQVGFQANMGITPSKGRVNLTVRPATMLTPAMPTIPVDGAPAGLPSADLVFEIAVPGEWPHVFAYPVTYLVGPEIAVGQCDYRLAYDPAEAGAKASPLGHAYQAPQHGYGNSWGSWHRLVPTRFLAGWSRTYACNWLPLTFRIGWHASRVTVKEDVAIDPARGGLHVMHTSGPWTLWKDGRPLDVPQASAVSGPFTRGLFATNEQAGGSTVLIAFDDRLHYVYDRNQIRLLYKPADGLLRKHQPVEFQVAFAGAGSGTTTEQMKAFAEKFGVARPGQVGYAAQVSRGRPIDNYLIWRLQADRGAVEAKLGRADLPAFLCAQVEGLNDQWTVMLLDRRRPWPNHRELPIRDGRAFAQLDLTEADQDLFIGHPVLADRPEIVLLVAWKEPARWFIEAHNPTDQPVRAALKSNVGWSVFDFEQAVELAPGTSRTWEVQSR